MITNAYDKTESMFGPKDFYGDQKHLCEKCIITFSDVIFDYMLENYKHEDVGIIKCANGIKTVYDPSHPDADEEGYVDLPNVNIVEEMVDMIAVMRSYEANQKILQAHDELLEKSVNQLGSLS